MPSVWWLFSVISELSGYDLVTDLMNQRSCPDRFWMLRLAQEKCLNQIRSGGGVRHPKGKEDFVSLVVPFYWQTNFFYETMPCFKAPENPLTHLAPLLLNERPSVPGHCFREHKNNCSCFILFYTSVGLLCSFVSSIAISATATYLHASIIADSYC